MNPLVSPGRSAGLSHIGARVVIDEPEIEAYV
jgi:hypothetical protein